MKAQRHCDTLDDVRTKALGKSLADTLAEAEVGILGFTLGNVEANYWPTAGSMSSIGRHRNTWRHTG